MAPADTVLLPARPCKEVDLLPVADPHLGTLVLLALDIARDAAVGGAGGVQLGTVEEGEASPGVGKEGVVVAADGGLANVQAARLVIS